MHQQTQVTIPLNQILRDTGNLMREVDQQLLIIVAMEKMGHGMAPLGIPELTPKHNLDLWYLILELS